MSERRTKQLRALLATGALVAFATLGCNSLGGAFSSLKSTTPTPVATVSETVESDAAALSLIAPTTAPDPALRNATYSDASIVQLIDAAGLDFAERRNIDVYQRVSPSVVNINTQVMVRTYFNIVPEEGSGSGFVLDDQGHILTNYHVIKNATDITVSFGDETQVKGTVVGTDPRNDLAVVKVDPAATTLVPVQLGASEDLQVGQWAIAIGNPFGQFDRTLTTGVISALNRSLEGDDGNSISGVIQTDAAINHGNSGGPLLDSSGRVIGITSAIYSTSGTSAGVGFAVPVDTIKRVLPDLLSLGYYRHPWLGADSGYALTPALAQALNLTTSEGILLVELQNGSPLAQAGVRGAQKQAFLSNQRVYIGGDILTAVNGFKVASSGDLNTYLEDNYRIGDTVVVELVRDGAPMTISVVLGEAPH